MNLLQKFKVLINNDNKVTFNDAVNRRDYVFTVAVGVLCIYALYNVVSAVVHTVKSYPLGYSWTELFINYQGGFIRRGIIGEILWQLGHIGDVLTIALIFLFAGFIFYYLFLYKKLMNAYDRYAVFFLFASPVLMFFVIYDWYITGRKEIFILISILLQFHFVSQYIQNKLPIIKTYLYFFTIFIIGVLIHEIVLFYSLLPALLLWQEECKRKSIKGGGIAFCVISVVLGLTGLMTLSLSGTKKEHADMLHASWVSLISFPNDTSLIGAIYYINAGTDDIKHMFETYWGMDLYSLYFGTFILGLLPVVITFFIYNTGKAINEYFALPFRYVFIAIGVLFPITLFYIIADHGRVISFTSMYWLFFILTMQEIAPQRPTQYYEKFICFIHEGQGNIVRVAVIIFVLYYALSWCIPHVGDVSQAHPSKLSIFLSSYLK